MAYIAGEGRTQGTLLGRGVNESRQSSLRWVRHRVSVRAKARGWVEAGVARSCGVLVERRGAKQKLGCGEPFDDMHGSAANRAVPEGVRLVSTAVAVVEVELSAELLSKPKQSGSSEARRRLARKPKLRIRMKPRGSRWRRKRCRNSSQRQERPSGTGWRKGQRAPRKSEGRYST
jgi:hypothetical protein